MQPEDRILHVPSGFEKTVRLTPEEFEQQVRLMAALKMFELGKLSSGKAAELAGLSRLDFFETCSRYRVSVVSYPDEEAAPEIDSELKTLDELNEA